MNKIELLFLAQSIKADFQKKSIPLDYSLKSLQQVEAYLAKGVSLEGPPKRANNQEQ